MTLARSAWAIPAPLDPATWRCLVQHLALAAHFLAIGDPSPGCTPVPAVDPARYRAAEARFRSLADASDSSDVPGDPAVGLPGAASVTLPSLLYAAWSLTGRPLPIRSGFDPLLVAAAEQLLSGLSWQIPE